MTAFETHTHSFIIKIWREEASITGNRVFWRGHITHVPDGKRRYLDDLDEIVAFIMPYLSMMGVHLPFLWRVKRRLAWWTRHVTSGQ